MGGPTLAKVSNCLCEDGVRRTVTLTSEPDSFFSQPAQTTRRCNGKSLTIKGFLTTHTYPPNDQPAPIFISTDNRPNRYISPEYRLLLKLMKEKDDPWTKRFPKQHTEALAFQGFPYDEPWYCWQ
jgi:hypothetical protein